MWAAKGGHADVCALLTERGANPNSTTTVGIRSTFVTEMCFINDCHERLKACYYWFLFFVSHWSFQPSFVHPAHQRLVSSFIILISLIYSRLVDQYRVTALMLAALGGHRDVCTVLLCCGADANLISTVSFSHHICCTLLTHCAFFCFQ